MVSFRGALFALVATCLLGGCAEDYPQITGVYRLQSITITGAQPFTIPVPNSIAVDTAGYGSASDSNFDLHFRFFEDGTFSRQIANRNSSGAVEAEITQALSSLVNCADLRETEEGGIKCVTPALSLPTEPGLSLGTDCSFNLQTTMMVFITPDPRDLSRPYAAAGSSNEKTKYLAPSDFQFQFVIQRSPVESMIGCSESDAAFLRGHERLRSFNLQLRYVGVSIDSSVDPFSRDSRQRAAAWQSSSEFSGLEGYFARVLNGVQ